MYLTGAKGSRMNRMIPFARSMCMAIPRRRRKKESAELFPRPAFCAPRGFSALRGFVSLEKYLSLRESWIVCPWLTIRSAAPHSTAIWRKSLLVWYGAGPRELSMRPMRGNAAGMNLPGKLYVWADLAMFSYRPCPHGNFPAQPGGLLTRCFREPVWVHTALGRGPGRKH